MGTAPVTYLVQYRTSQVGSTPAGSWITASVAQTATSTTINGLTDGVSYDIQVTASSASGAGPATIATGFVPIGAPLTPQLVVDNVAGSSTSLQISWNYANTGGTPITSVNLYRWNGSAWVIYQTFSSSTTPGQNIINAQTWTDTGLTAGSIYYYKVSITNAYGTSPQTAQIQAFPVANVGAPTSFSVLPGHGSVTLSWAAPATYGAAIHGFTISRSIDGSNWGTPIAVDTANNSLLSYVDQGVVNGTQYYYKVAATTALGIGAYTSPVATTPVGPSSAPSNLMAVTADSQVTLTWNPPINSGGSPVTGYRILECNSATVTGSGLLSSNCSVQVTPNTNTTATSYVVPSLTNGTTYYFGVQALTSASPAQGYVAIVTAVPRALVPAVTSLAAAPADQQITLSWTAPTGVPTGYPVSGYRVDLCSISVCTDSDYVTLTSNTQSTTTSYVVTGLTDGVLYSFRVYPVTAPYSNGSVYGSYASITGRPGVIPSAPLAFTAVPGNGQATLSWQPPVNNGGGLPYQYYITYGTSTGSMTAAPNTNGGYVSSGTTSVVVNGLTNGTAYYFAIQAVNSLGAGSYASGNVGNYQVNAPTTVGTVATAPTSLSATVANSQVTLTWSTPSNTGGLALLNYAVQEQFGTTWAPATGVSSCVSGTCTQVIGGLTNGTSYNFQVAYVTAAGTGAFASIQATPYSTAGGVQNIAAIVSNGGVTLFWTAPQINGGQSITGYIVQQTSPATVVYSTSAALPGLAGFQISGLTNGSSYTFQIIPVTTAGNGTAANITATPAALPGAPASAVSNVGNQLIGITWVAPNSATNGGLAIGAYNIQYSPDNGTTWLPQNPASVVSTTLSYTFQTDSNNQINNGQSYIIRVRSVNAVGVSAWVQVGNVIPGIAPLAPIGLTAAADASTPTPVPGAINTTWSAPNNGGAPITSYEVDYTTNEAIVTSAVANGSSITYGYSSSTAFSAGQIVTIAGLSTAAFNLVNVSIASSSSNTFTINSTATGANVYSASGFAAVWSPASTTISSTNTSYQVVGLSANTNYWIRVAATNAIGQGTFAYSSQVTTSSAAVSTVGSATSLSVSNVLATSVKLSYTQNTGATTVTGRKVEISLVNPDGSYAGWSTYTGSTLPGISNSVAPISASTATSLQIVGLQPSSQYAVRVTPYAQVSPGIYTGYISTTAT